MSEQEQTTTTGLGQEAADAVDALDGGSENLNTEAQNQEGGAASDAAAAAPENSADAGNSDNGAYGAPENYDFKGLQLPEGFQIDEALAAKFAPIGKELNLSQQSANKLANLLVEIQQEQLADAPNKIAEYKKQEQEAVRLSYEKLLNTDKEIGGGDKAKMNAYLDVADVGYNAFATPELKNVLQDLHLDYHPAVIKLFHRLGKLCGNDNITKTNIPVGAKQNAADILYGNNSEE